jgi:hypothetical protein
VTNDVAEVALRTKQEHGKLFTFSCDQADFFTRSGDAVHSRYLIGIVLSPHSWALLGAPAVG